MTTSPTFTRTDTRSRAAVMADAEKGRRQAGAAAADELQLMARAEVIAAEQTARIPSSAGREREMPRREIAAELAATLHVSERGMVDRMHDAWVLVEQFPSTVAALRAGLIGRGHVRLILQAGERITDPEARARFEQAALAVCEIETPGRAKPSIAVIAQRLHPIPLEERHAEAAAGRRVWVRDLEDGMAEITAALPAPLAYAIQDRLNQYAREITAAHRAAAVESAADAAQPEDTDAEAGAGTETDTAGDTAAEVVATDTRTTDQIRADVFADLLLTGHATAPISNGSIPETAAIFAQVQIIIPADTLSGRGTDPAELVGYGPIDPETARRLAATAEVWERVFTCPVTGAVEEVDTYRPSRAQRRHLDARDEHCRFPGCRRPARRCEHDHTIDAARGGPTALCNLANLCARHHAMKHATAWTVVQKVHGILEWTSPTGRVFPDIPRRVLEFTALAAAAAAEPAPF